MDKKRQLAKLIKNEIKILTSKSIFIRFTLFKIINTSKKENKSLTIILKPIDKLYYYVIDRGTLMWI